jgi:ribosomal protein S8E
MNNLFELDQKSESLVCDEHQAVNRQKARKGKKRETIKKEKKSQPGKAPSRKKFKEKKKRTRQCRRHK